MIRPIDDFSKIAIAAHPKLPEAINTSAQISRYFNKLGYRPFSAKLDDEELPIRIKNGKFDLLIALGGDGTMLRAGHICSPYQVPILGINLGHFGFLAEIRGNQWREYLPRILKGDYWLERRMMLNAKHIRDGKIIRKSDVLNEVVVGRGKFIHPVHFITSVDGRLLTTYVADALIAATATGSTAYALAAGGPILPPELRNILLVAVAPHLSIDRAIVLAEGSSVNILIQTDHDALLCIDGQTPTDLNSGDEIEVQASENNTQFVRFHDPGYFYRNLTPHMEQNPSTGQQR
jgi:NAD+ kinase